MTVQPKQTTLQAALTKLNTEQRRAVETLEGPVMVIAGPGTGKTQVLALRVAQILQETDTAPSAILALTFTEAAAKNMRARLVKYIGSAAYQVQIQTFHAFCDEIIQTHPTAFPLPRQGMVVTEVEQYQIFEHLLQTLPLQHLRTVNSAYHYVRPLMKYLSDLKREGVSPERFRQLAEGMPSAEDDLVAKKAREKALEVATVYAAYQERLGTTKRYDFDDMIGWVEQALQRDDELRQQYQERFLYILVDEYQDTNAVQNLVVDHLSAFWAESANVFVVGDPHQSIYRFQGASLENTLHFLTRYPKAQVITLTQGYRCPQVIYTAAAAVIAQNIRAEAIEAKLLKQLAAPLHQPAQKPNTPIHVMAAQDPVAEAVAIATELAVQHTAGVAWREMAVLYRNRADAEELLTVLAAKGVPVQTDLATDALEDVLVNQVLDFWTLLVELRTSQEQSLLFTVLLQPWWHVDVLKVMQLTRQAAESQVSLWSTIMAAPEPDLATRELQKLLQLFLQWSAQETQQLVMSWCTQVLAEAKIFGELTKPAELAAQGDRVRALFILLQEVQRRNREFPQLRLTEVLQAFQTMRTQGLPLTVPALDVNADAVTLSTVHKAKGLEWSLVWVLACTDGKWGNARRKASLPIPPGILAHTQLTDVDRNEDDRRLFYVALTRAKSRMFLSYPQRQVIGGRTREFLPSQFIHELPDDVRVEMSPPAADSLAAQLPTLISPPVLLIGHDTHREWLQSIVQNMRLSVSAINEYLRDPAQFFLHAVIRIPQPKVLHQVYGTAMHRALETMFRQVLAQQSLPPLAELHERFVAELQRGTLLPMDYQRATQKGLETLKQFAEWVNAQDYLPKTVMVEKGFGYGGRELRHEGIPLTGRIDRVDWIDPTAKTLRIIDYKTGGAKTVNQIEGKVSVDEFSLREQALPLAIRGPYKRQLLFYKLLTDLDPQFPGEVTEGAFLFVEPDRRGKFVERTFAFDQAEVDQLKDLICVVWQEIQALQFLETKD